ncbi:MAG: capsule assembly Wzi family protein [Candidatus Woykebacteria bacterium]
MKYLLLLWLPFLLCIPQGAEAQTIPVGDPLEEYVRYLYLDGNPSFNIRPISGIEIGTAGVFPVPEHSGAKRMQQGTRRKVHPWQDVQLFNSDVRSLYGLYTPSLMTTYNSEMAFGQNDGALWQGRGLNSAVSFGGYLDVGPLHVSFRPVITYSQNREFELSPFDAHPEVSAFSAPFDRRYDVPQRFGSDPFSRFDLGESSVELQYKGFAAGVSNKNIWTGPAVQNPILFSNNAPGFLHGFLGTYRPVTTPIGSFEGRLIWGGLRESDYFDEDPGNDLRFINAVTLNYSPSFIPGLSIGAVRTFLLTYPEDGLDTSDFFSVAIPFTKENFYSEDSPQGNDDGYQMISLFGRWAFPSAGFEVYGEWARNDHSRDNRDLSIHFTHARAFMFGGVKRLELSGNRWLVFNTEWTNISAERGGSSEYRSAGTYYTNGTVIQGFTNRGQLMGAAIGPGSDSQLGKVRLYDEWGLAGLSFNRIDYQQDRLERNLDTINSAQEGTYQRYELNEVEYRFGLHGLVFLPYNLEVQADIYQSRFFNRHNIYGDDVSNTNVQVTVRYQLESFRR